MRLPLASIALVLATMMPAVAAKKAAQGLEGLSSLLTIRGNCSHLILYGSDKTSECKTVVLNTAFRNGRTGFYFSTDNGLLITFSGNGNMQVKEDVDSAVQPIDLIIVGGAGDPAKIPAVGTCRIHNPYNGPVPLDCAASTALGRFEGNFVTDGGKPERKDF